MENIQSGTGTGLIEFLDYAGNKGLLKSATSRSYRSAVVKILGIDDDDVDIRSLDIEDHFQRFERISGHNYTPGSLGTYKARFSSAVEMYLSYLQDPSGFKPPVRQRRSGRSSSPAKGDSGQPEAFQSSGTNTERDRSQGELLMYPFPLRSGQTAHLELPRQLSTEDVERMSAFLKSLAIDPPLQLPAGDSDA